MGFALFAITLPMTVHYFLLMLRHPEHDPIRTSEVKSPVFIGVSIAIFAVLAALAVPFGNPPPPSAIWLGQYGALLYIVATMRAWQRFGYPPKAIEVDSRTSGAWLSGTGKAIIVVAFGFTLLYALLWLPLGLGSGVWRWLQVFLIVAGFGLGTAFLLRAKRYQTFFT